MAPNTWYHVAGVYNATVQTLDIFVNGVVDDGTLTNPIGARSSVPSVQVLPPAGVNANIGQENGRLLLQRGRRRRSCLSAGAVPGGDPGRHADRCRDAHRTRNHRPLRRTLTPTVVSGTQVNLSWPAATDNVGVAGYRVERCQKCRLHQLHAGRHADRYDIQRSGPESESRSITTESAPWTPPATWGRTHLWPQR